MITKYQRQSLSPPASREQNDAWFCELDNLQRKIVHWLRRLHSAIKRLMRRYSKKSETIIVEAISHIRDCHQQTESLRNQIAAANVGLMATVERLYVNSRLNHEEIMSAANKGLGCAINDFDRCRGSAFSTVAYRYMFIELFHNNRYQSAQCRDPKRTVSLTDNVACNLIDDDIGPADQIVDRPLPDVYQVLQQTSELDEREKSILTDRFGLDGRPVKTLEEIGREYGVTKERVYQLEVRALGKLQDNEGLYQLFLEHAVP